MYLLRSRADGGGDGSDGKCTASSDCIVGILRFLTITVNVKLRLAQLLGPTSWNVLAQIPKLEDRGDEHFFQWHDRYSWSVSSKIKQLASFFTLCPSQELLDILSMSHPGVTIDGVIPGHEWILSMCHPGGTRGRLSLSSRHKTIKHNGNSTQIGISVASHLVLASKTMLIAL